MRRSDCLNDLVARARRYRLSRAEQSCLDEHLSICASCRVQHQIGADFDSMGGLRPGDGVLIERLAEMALQRPSKGRVHPNRLRSIAMITAAAFVLFAAMAGASALVRHRPSASLQGPKSIPVSLQPVACEPPDRPGCGAPPELTGEVAPPIREQPTMSLSRASSSEVRGPSRALSLHNAHTIVTDSAAPQGEARPAQMETASSLFARANNERRHDHVAAAISLYGELERRYPGSDEARISHVSLGRLLLDRGIWSEGLSQLNDYLVSSPEGMLAPEALFGKARALKALGRRDEERGAWNRLVTSFADSVYATQARRRLEELR
jgi:hypothetical protein